jgi:MFS transporter, DHA2 family, glioxin efflux transporter
LQTLFRKDMAFPQEATRASSLSSQTFRDNDSMSLPVKEGTGADVDERQTRSDTRLSNDSEKEEKNEKDAPVEAEENQYPTAANLIFIVVALILSMFLMALDMTIIATAIPKITDEFKSLDQVAWYGSAFFLTLASFQSTAGKAYKYFPLKWTFLLSIFIFEIGSLICGVAPNSTALIVGRAIAGLGAAGIASGVYIIIAFSAPPHQRPALTGVLGATYSVASVVGPLLGGVFTSDVSWRWWYVSII